MAIQAEATSEKRNDFEQIRDRFLKCRTRIFFMERLAGFFDYAVEFNFRYLDLYFEFKITQNF